MLDNSSFQSRCSQYPNFDLRVESLNSDNRDLFQRRMNELRSALCDRPWLVANRDIPSVVLNFVGCGASESSWGAFVDYARAHAATRKTLCRIAKAFKAIHRFHLDDVDLGVVLKAVQHCGANGDRLLRMTSTIESVLAATPDPVTRKIFRDFCELLRESRDSAFSDFRFVIAEASKHPGTKEQSMSFAVACFRNNWNLASSYTAYAKVLEKKDLIPPPLRDELLTLAAREENDRKRKQKMPRVLALASFIANPSEAGLLQRGLNLYRQKGWNAGPLFADVAGHLRSFSQTYLPERKEVLFLALDHYFSQGWHANKCVKRFMEMNRCDVAQMRQSIEQAIAHKLSVDTLPDAAISRAAAPNVQVWRHFDDLYRLLPEGLPALAPRMQRFVTEFSENGAAIPPFRSNNSSDPIDIQVSKYLHYLESIGREGSIEKHMVTLIRETDSKKIAAAQAAFQHMVQNDTLPYPLELPTGGPNPPAVKAFNETVQVTYRGFDLYFGFGALTYEARRADHLEYCTLARFGMEVSKQVSIVNTADRDAFPGGGFLINGISPGKVFGIDMGEAVEGGDPLRRFKQALPWAAAEFDLLEKTTFVFARGFVAVIPPGDKALRVRDTHYSYLVFNQHFHPLPGARFVMIPTPKLEDLLAGLAVPIDDYVGFTKKSSSADAVISSPQTIMAAASNELLNLGWGSNLGGGLSNAFLPGQGPNAWEMFVGSGHTRDIFGHIHKSHILGSYESVMSIAMDKHLVPLREAHDNIYRLATSSQNLFDLFRLGLSLWHKGFTLGGGIDGTDRGGAADEMIFLDPAGNSPISNLMLKEAYRWNAAFGPNGACLREKCPILTLAPTFNYWDKPNGALQLDTFSLELIVNGERFNLPVSSTGDGETENEIWQRHVAPLASPTSVDLRFYDRGVFS